ncbi:hypothetical protein RFI_16025 [Reticulomyxa filosa]|uniref:Uncharacterized protein n=1 Tax=Reticulomyxa filosa TaxID=46433 RepID=X6N4F7_RETFI|nr:hypothetical protein RFI_16025 [Reticulomyxa filosa]|eukprot:ETO21180.1 hypothetical protein RFI_16025 [Reticulomyxa filosa]
MDAGTKAEGHHSTEEKKADVQQDHSVAVPSSAPKEANTGIKPQGEAPTTTGTTKRKALKEITKKHPEFELSYDMMVGIRYAVSLSEPSVSLPSSKTHTNTMSESLKYPDVPSDDELIIRRKFRKKKKNFKKKN